jgi:hypothetical protein
VKRALVTIAVVAGIALGAALPACTLFEDRPSRTCQDDLDCFVAQGERCNEDTNECETIDAAAAALEEEP